MTEEKKEPSRRKLFKFGGVALATSLVGSRSTRQEMDLFKRSGYKLVFEPGAHAVDLKEIAEVKRRFEEGDINAHVWPAQVAKRMKQYHPQVVALDSVSPFRSDFEGIWRFLPGSPKEMTGRESVLLLGGDPVYSWTFSTAMPGTFGYEVVKQESNDENLYVQFFKAEILSTMVGGLALMGTGIYLNAEHNKSSRRDFIKKGSLAIGGGLLFLTAGRTARQVQSYLENDMFNGLLSTITELTRPITRSSWLDGRTAFVIAKTRDAMQNLELPQGSTASLVFGSSHAYEANPLMRDKNYRARVMREFAGRLIEITIEVNKRFPALNWSEDQKPVADDILRESALAFLCQGSIRRVNEPVIEPGQTPQKAVVKAFEPKQFFVSREVREALRPFGEFDEKYLHP